MMLINYKLLIKFLISLFLISIFSYVFYFSLENIINNWTYSEIHINYSLGFTKRGFLGSIMLYLESIGFPKKKFFSLIFYLITLCNIILFLTLINKFKNNNVFIYVFFALNPALLLFSFYDLGGYARSETFGICVCLLHSLFAQRYYYFKIKYKKYLQLLLIVIWPLSLTTVLIHELNILFLFFHFLTAASIANENKFKEIFNLKFLIFFNLLLTTLIIYLLFTHPFTKEFSKELYANLKNNEGVDYWVWESIGLPFRERVNLVLLISESIVLYFLIFLFYAAPITILLAKTSKKNNLYIFGILFSTIPFIFLFIIGIDWGRWIHILILVIFSYLIQFREKKIEILKNNKYKFFKYFFIFFFVFQFFFTRIPHCCNLVQLKLNVIGGFIPKVEVFYKMLNQNFDIKKRFQNY